MEETLKQPSIKQLVLTDLGTIFCFFISLVLVPILFVYSIIYLWPFTEDKYAETWDVLVILVSTWSIFLLAGAWWTNVMANTFKNGLQLEGKITAFDKPVGPYFAVSYEFQHLGNKIVHRTAFLNHQRVRKLAANIPITVLYNP